MAVMVDDNSHQILLADNLIVNKIVMLVIVLVK